MLALRTTIAGMDVLNNKKARTEKLIYSWAVNTLIVRAGVAIESSKLFISLYCIVRPIFILQYAINLSVFIIVQMNRFCQVIFVQKSRRCT
jgi:hypothetical protein